MESRVGEPHNNARNRSIEALIGPIARLPGIRLDWMGDFQSSGQVYRLPRVIFDGPNSGEPIRIGLFGAIHGDEPAGAIALCKFIEDLAMNPLLVENFHLQIYPICNPTGYEDNTRHSRNGKDLNREFWKNSAEPEVRLIEAELRAAHFSGLMQLHADDTSDGIYGFVRGHTLTENLLRPALCEAGKIVPRNVNAIIDGFAARDGIIAEHYEGILKAPAEMDPVPFEIILETPHHAPMDLQVKALVVAIETILMEYRQLISFAANI